jgi:hypothetical protein
MKLFDHPKVSVERKFTEINDKIHYGKESYAMTEVIRRWKLLIEELI